jgi:dTDP-4-amino-4,6-dideoxygalactose transaminase
MHVPFLDLKAQYQSIKTEIDAAIRDVIESQHFSLGPKVEACEQAVAAYCGCSHAIGVSSGSDALLACLMTEGIGPGDEVITTAYTFFATAGAIARVGAMPRFVDIDPVTFNLDTAQIERTITPRTRAIIPVHLFGQMADMNNVMRVAAAHDLVVIEDAAQAIGAEHRGRRAGAVGHYGCFSFFPSKNLGAVGDGGMIVTNDPFRAGKLRCLRDHGAKPKYHHHMIGGNFRLDALQAAVVSAKLPHLDAWTASRRRHAERYDSLFAAADGSGVSPVARPAVVTDRHVFNQYVIRVPRRDQLKKALWLRGIESEIYYPVPMHLQRCFGYLEHQPGGFPESERAANETLALPIHPGVTDMQAAYVVNCIRDFLAAEREASGALVEVPAAAPRAVTA